MHETAAGPGWFSSAAPDAGAPGDRVTDIAARRPLFRELALVVAICLAVLFLRLGSFERSVLDPDESLYLLIAESMLRGQVPYVEIWDHKPPGIYFLFAMGQAVFGQSIAAIRLLGCLAVAATCSLLLRFGRDVLGRTSVGALAALFYAIFSLTNDGLASNTEIFFTPFVVAGLFLVCRHPRPFAWLFAAGLSFGIALELKYVTALELTVAVGVLAVISREDPDRRIARFLTRAGAVAAGAVVPFALATLYFAIAGHLETYWDANFTANAIHAAGTRLSLEAVARTAQEQLRENFLLWCAAVASPIVVLIYGRSDASTRRTVGLLLAWTMAGLIGASATRRFYPHYFLQPLPALSLLAGYVLWKSVSPMAELPRVYRALPIALMIVPSIVLTAQRPAREAVATVLRASFEPNDLPAEIAAYLNPRIDAHEFLYVADYQPVLYYLVEARRPTRFLFPQFLTSRHFSRVARVDPDRELDRIFSLRPKYVVALDPPGDTPFRRALERHLDGAYTREGTFEGVAVFRIKEVGSRQ